MTAPSSCLCGANGDQFRHIRWPSFAERKLYQCKSCGVVQLFPAPKHDGGLESIYQDASYLSKIDSEEYYGYFKALEGHLRTDLNLPRKIRILDFGAGRCYYHKFFLEEGYGEVHSVEINKQLVRFATEQLGLRNIYCTTSELPREHYDLVISNQVFEHLTNPLYTLHDTILPLVKPGGLICFTVPNWHSLNRPVLGKLWLGYSPNEHIWFFSDISVRNLLSESVDLEVSDVSVKSAVGKPYDAFRPKGILKRTYYNSLWRLFENLGRGDQLIVALRKK